MLELEDGLADLDPVAVKEGGFSDRRVVQERAVGRLHIADHERVIRVLDQLEVRPAHRDVRDHHRAVLAMIDCYV